MQTECRQAPALARQQSLCMWFSMCHIPDFGAAGAAAAGAYVERFQCGSSPKVSDEWTPTDVNDLQAGCLVSHRIDARFGGVMATAHGEPLQFVQRNPPRGKQPVCTPCCMRPAFDPVHGRRLPYLSQLLRLEDTFNRASLLPGATSPATARSETCSHPASERSASTAPFTPTTS